MGFLFFVVHYYNQNQEMLTLKENVVKIKNISRLINDLQQERGLSSGFIGSHGEAFKQQLLKKRLETDRSFDIFLSICHTHYMQYKELKRSLDLFRKQLDSNKITTKSSFDFYTNFIQNIQANYLQITTNMVV